MAQNAAAALTIGTSIRFASVAHGTGHDIAGKGVADPAAMIEAVLMMAKAKKSASIA
jgi:4-hydroxy-L-threonine phosphate dehydrogenase PdxA